MMPNKKNNKSEGKAQNEKKKKKSSEALVKKIQNKKIYGSGEPSRSDYIFNYDVFLHFFTFFNFILI